MHVSFNQHIGFVLERYRGVAEQLNLQGYYPLVEHIRDGQVIGTHRIKNGITIEGKNYILNVAFNDATKLTTWAVGLISSSGYSALNESDTMGSHPAWTEFTTYNEATRPAWGQGTASAKTITNATPAVFTITGSGTLKGIFIASNTTKGGTTGTLWAHGLFNADVPVAASDQIRITYTVAA